MNRNLLKEVIIDQQLSENTKSYVKRYDYFSNSDTGNLTEIISGVRRCGKSTLLAEIRSTQNPQ
jgi:predicted AAA+ superfamily ATPase